ncbi:ECF transporter S component [Ktedonosporobacter rubrisoli]|uniref:ECF transporter S component n=1 Tax=Ktedonosporobacter rubrisoli TaxID=2509675 RepID=A0A4P6JQA9_KTERU|nr:ECF transporter S component [Ktedonosporobacter rubrisoli]QBD77598.1 ECF transporter S component [Ktedonosporobacter rubrisoli]
MQGEKQRASLFRDFNTRVIVLIPIAIAINIAIGQIVLLLKLPVYLDSIGTVLVAIVAGPLAGGLTGALANIIWGALTAPSSIPYAIVALAIGGVAGIFANLGFFRSWWKVIITGIIISLVAALLSAPITVGFFGGVTPNGSTLVTAYLEATGKNLITSVFTTSFLVEPLDKIVTCLIAWAILRSLSARYISRFPRANNIRPAEKKQVVESKSA